MLTEATIFTIIVNWLVLGWLVITNQQTQRKVMAGLNDRLAAIESNLNEGFDELTGEIAKLREQLGTVTPETEAILARLEAKSAALKDVIANA